MSHVTAPYKVKKSTSC